MSAFSRGILLGFVALALAPGAAAVSLSFDVTTPVFGAGTVSIDPLDTPPQLVVDVQVSGLGSGGPPSVRSYDLTVTFGTSQLSLASVVFGTALGTPLSQTTNTAVSGQVQVQEISFEPASFFNSQATTITLFTLSFNANLPGLTQLNFLSSPPGNPLLLSDVSGNPLSVTVTPRGVRVIPEPAVAWLLALGVVCAGFRRRTAG